MERITNVRINSLSKAVSGMSDISVESVYLSGGGIYVKDIEGNIYDLAKMGCGCSTPRANVIATLLRGVDGKDGKTQDLSEYYKKSEVDGKLGQKVDKVGGKGLSSEDFTTALKNKLEALQNYDDRSISAAVTKLRKDFDTLVESDTSGAIDKFDEIIAFLDGIEDSQSLDNIIASIEQQIAGKQDTIDNLDAIAEGAAKGSTSVQNVKVNGEEKKPVDGVVDLGTIGGGVGNVSFIDNNSLQGLPFGYIGGYFRSYEFDGVSFEEVNLGYIDDYYYDTIAIAHNDVLYEERIRGLMGDGKLLGTVVVRVDDSYNLFVKQVSPKKTTFGWRIYSGKQLMSNSWVDLENYYSKNEVDSAIASAITTTLNTPV